MNKRSRTTRYAIIASLFVALAFTSMYAKSNFRSVTNRLMPSTILQAGDDAAIQAYIKTNKLTAKKTASGLYYVVDKQGTGEKVTKGKNVSVNYTGKLLNGTTFDSSVDPAFGHVQPLTFPVGVGRVIKGWDEGLLLYNVGGKGKLLIPSALAYGPQAMGDKIPANSILVFDIEITGLTAGQ